MTSVLQHKFRAEFDCFGWRFIDNSIYERLGEFQGGSAIVSPPLDTIPSPHGNAIYTIVQEYAALWPQPCIVIAAWPQDSVPAQCSISDRIFYCRRPFQSVPLEKQIPHRVKRAIWGTGRPEILHYARQAARLCRLLEINTIVVEDIPTYARVIRKIVGGVPTIVLHQHINSPSNISRFWWRRIQKSLDGIAFVAEQTRQETHQRHGAINVQNVVAYNGVDLSMYSPEEREAEAMRLRAQLGISADETVMLFVGRMIPGKGPAEAVEAFNLANIGNARFLLAGPLAGNMYQDDRYIERLKTAVANSRGRAVLLGKVSQAELPTYYAASNVVIIPSLQPEGLPKVMTEAFAMGKPVISSNRGGVPEFLRAGQNGWVIEEPENPRSMAASISHALADKDILRSMADTILKEDRPTFDLNYRSACFYNFVQSVTRKASS